MRYLLVLAILAFVPAICIASNMHIEGKEPCLTCHEPSSNGVRPELKAPVNEICAMCHPDRLSAGEHKVGGKPKENSMGLPLDLNGNMTCATCHEPHGLSGHPKLLRVSPTALCQSCHQY